MEVVRTYALLTLYYATTWPSRFPGICQIIAKPHISILFLNFLFTPSFFVILLCLAWISAPFPTFSGCQAAVFFFNFLVVVKYLFYLFVWLCWVLVAACRIFDLHWSTQDLVPRAGIKPRPPALGVWSLSHWTTGKAPQAAVFNCDCGLLIFMIIKEWEGDGNRAH